MVKVKVFFRSEAGGVEFRKIYSGEMKNIDGKIFVKYQEIDENGKTDTEICIVGIDFVTVKREGQFSNYLEFKENYVYKGEYLTPYGKIPVEAFTTKLKVEIENGLPKILATYKSSLMGEKTENNFSLAVKLA